MPRACTVCSHPDRTRIDEALVGGEGHLTLGKRYHLSKDAVRRHAESHLPAVLVKAGAAAEAANADALLAELQRLKADAQRVRVKAEKRKDYRAALAGIRELVRIVELAARLGGELQSGVTVNVAILPEWVALRTTILQALQPYPEARMAVTEALGASHAT